MKHFFLSLTMAIACLNTTADVLDLDRDHLLNLATQRPLVMIDKAQGDQLQPNTNGGSSNSGPLPTGAQSCGLSTIRELLESFDAAQPVADALYKDKIAFCNMYSYSFYNAENVKFYGNWGGQHISMRRTSQEGLVYCENFIYDGLTQPLYIDKSDNSVTMPTFVLSGTQYKTEVNGLFRDEITSKFYMINWDYLSQNAEPADIHGQLLDDGSIAFDDDFCYYMISYTRHYDAKGVLRSKDTTEYMTYMFHDLTLIVPNAKHDFKDLNNESRSADVYMYQPDDTTVVAMNLWGLGGQGSVMYIHPDGSMLFPLQRLFYYNVESYNQEGLYYSPYFYNFNGTIATAKAADTHGNVTDGVISWGTNTVADYYIYGEVMLKASTGNYLGMYFGCYSDNQLHYTDLLPSDSPMPGDVNGDGIMNISDVTTLTDLLLSTASSDTMPDNTDVNGDGTVNISDVTTLIDTLLGSHD